MERATDAAVGIIPIYKKDDGTFLLCLVKHADGHWGFPKGHVEKGESNKAAALRELREETGIADISLDTNKRFAERYSFERDGVHYDKEVAYFVGFAESMHGRTEEAFENEITEVCWLPYEEARRTITFEESRGVLDEAHHYLESKT